MSPTKIEWTGETWNPTTGCDRVSPGCDNCYALTLAKRLKAIGQAHYQNDGDPRTSGPGFGLTVHPDSLDKPLSWRKPRTVFVNSMSDLFHPSVPDEFIGQVFDVMMRTSDDPGHVFQVLTKRPQRMRAFVEAWLGESWGQWISGLWLGTSIESDKYTFRADHLRATPAAVRFLSLEPLLGPLPSLDLTGIDWVIVGGESGPGARPMRPMWVREIRDRCIAAGVPFFLKQWGAFVPTGPGCGCPDRYRDAAWQVGDEFWPVWRVGKKAAGRLLDGRTWDEMPT